MRKWKAWLFALAVLIGIGTIGTVSMKAEAQNLNQGKRGTVYQLVFLWMGYSPDTDRRNQGGGGREYHRGL